MALSARRSSGWHVASSIIIISIMAAIWGSAARSASPVIAGNVMDVSLAKWAAWTPHLWRRRENGSINGGILQ